MSAEALFPRVTVSISGQKTGEMPNGLSQYGGTCGEQHLHGSAYGSPGGAPSSPGESQAELSFLLFAREEREV